MVEEHLIPEPPHKDDVLFRSQLPDWQNNACIDATKPGGDEHAVTEGYRRGARRLVEYVTENGREQDYLVYPILFLYRHHIELALKSIIRRAPYVTGQSLTKEQRKNLNTGHQLDLLWQDLKPMFATVCEAAGWDKVSSFDEEGVESHIRQLTELDPDSFSFRYPGNKEGVPYLPPSLTVINLRHFAEMVERLAEYLDALDMAVGVLYDAKQEMEAEWCNEMAQYMDYA